MAKKNIYSFPSGKLSPNFKTVIITGLYRSGKTTLGNLLATNRNVEHSEEPWILDILPILTKLGLMDKTLGKEMFVAYLRELMNDTVLLRKSNFRPGDASSIWTKKSAEDIFSRLVNLQTRSDVANFVKNNKPTLLLVMPNSPLFNLSAAFDFIPDCKIIHVVRRGADVAREIKEKGWWSDEQLKKPPHSRIYHQTVYKERSFYVPCWIEPKDAKRFVGYPEYERALFYWCVLAGNMIKSLEKMKNKKRRLMTVKFDDLIDNPRGTLTKVNSFLNMKPSSMTEKALYEIRSYKNIRSPVPELPEGLMVMAKKIYKSFGYGWN